MVRAGNPEESSVNLSPIGDKCLITQEIGRFPPRGSVRASPETGLTHDLSGR
jgi:hypothetical protein